MNVPATSNVPSLLLAVIVPVVKIRPVGVLVFHALMRVRVRMGHRAGNTIVFVFVMSVIVAMPVLVRHAVMPVDVPVLLTEEEQQRAGYQRCRHGLNTGEGLSQEQQRQDYTEERRRREHHLAARGPQTVRRRDVESYADTVGERSDQEGEQNRNSTAHTTKNNTTYD